MNDLHSPPFEGEEDFTTGAGFLARSRKAVVAAVGAIAASATPAILAITGDGIVTAAEVVPAAIITAGFGLAAFVAVWNVPNAQA